MSVPAACSTFSYGMLHPFSAQKHTLSGALDELSSYFKKTMQLIPNKPLTFTDVQTLLSRLTVLDRHFTKYFDQRKSLKTSVDYLNLEVPLKDHWKTSPPALDYLNIELPQLPFFHHFHPFDNLDSHQHLYNYVCEKRPHVMMALIENLAARYFNSLEFLTTPLEAFDAIEEIDREDCENLRLRIPPKTAHFILQKTLSVFQPEHLHSLGEGAYGRVSVVKDMTSSYALKALKPMGLYKDDCLRHLLHESCNLLALPEHPSIVKIQAVNSQGIFFSYDYGFSFSEIVNSPSASYSHLCEYFLSISQGLEHLHTHGLAHLDLKENNVIIEYTTPKAKLIDLGLAKLDKGSQTILLYSMITPPEVILKPSNIKQKHPYDVWAFGVLLYQALTLGYLPFHHKNRKKGNYPELVANFCQDNPCSIDLLVSQLSSKRRKALQAKDPHRHLLELSARCLHGNPTLRPLMSEITRILSSYHQTNQK
jgi:hypothetical protein